MWTCPAALAVIILFPLVSLIALSPRAHSRDAVPVAVTCPFSYAAHTGGPPPCSRGPIGSHSSSRNDAPLRRIK